MEMELIVPIMVALILIVIAWKVLKGLAKTVVLVGEHQTNPPPKT